MLRLGVVHSRKSGNNFCGVQVTEASAKQPSATIQIDSPFKIEVCAKRIE